MIENILMVLWAALLPGATLIWVVVGNWNTISRALVASIAMMMS
jgi:hypothetical protein